MQLAWERIGEGYRRKDHRLVTTASASDLTVPLLGSRHHFLLRRLHSLTGILFGGYIIIHLLVNATLAEGPRTPGEPTVFQQQVDKIHSLPFLLVVEWTFIYLPIIFHTVYGIWITLTGQPNVDRYGYAKNWAYVGAACEARLYWPSLSCSTC